jgi:hypothetical protein
MCYFMFAVTGSEIDYSLIQKNYDKSLFVTDRTDSVKNPLLGNFYYEINNGHCACDLAVKPYDRIEEIKEVLKSAGKEGEFRFIVIDSQYEDEYLQFEENADFERTLETKVKEKLTLSELLNSYPEKIEFDKVYITK